MPDMLWLLMVTLVAGAVLGTPSLVLAQPDDIAAAPTLVPPESDAASTQPPLVVNTGITPLSDFPKGVLAAMGQSAVPLVQTQAAAIASAHNTSTAQLLSMLERDSDLGIDKTGRLVYVCSITSKNGTLEGGGSSAHQMAVAALADDPEPPIDRAFLLHSRPEVPIKLYLNFRGCRVTGTAWNDASGISTINIAAYDIDGSPTFNAEELTRVVGIWRAVAEDYEPWGIDVTTEWPGAAALQRWAAVRGRHGQPFPTLLLMTCFQAQKRHILTLPGQLLWVTLCSQQSSTPINAPRLHAVLVVSRRPHACSRSSSACSLAPVTCTLQAAECRAA
jgi:hypothetical protein